MAKKFMYVCAGLLMLAGAYHLGSQNAVAQLPGDQVAAAQWFTMDSSSFHVALATVNGDVYRGFFRHGTVPEDTWIYVGSLHGGVVSGSQDSLGDVKAQFR